MRPASTAKTASAAHCHGPSAPVAGNGRGTFAYDFVFDACANGQQIKCLTVIDEYTRECLAIDVAGSIRSGRVIEVLAKLVSVHGAHPGT
jgi:putative transposase